MSGSPPHIKREPGPTSIVTDAKPARVYTSHLEQLGSSSSVSELESAVQVGIRLSEDLKAPLNATQGNGDPQVAHWLQCIQQVELKAKPARTVVGIM